MGFFGRHPPQAGVGPAAWLRVSNHLTRPSARGAGGSSNRLLAPRGDAVASWLGMASEHDVRRICLALPDVTERLSWGRPAWFARTLVARMWDDDVVTIKTEEREALTASDPEVFYWTPHHDRSPSLVLVRLLKVELEELEELLSESYRLGRRSR